MDFTFNTRVVRGARYDTRSQTLIFGATGFIGAHLSDSLDAQPVDSINSSLNVKNIVHLLGSPSSTLDSTSELVALDIEIARFARAKKARVIYSSGNNVYPLGHVSLDTPKRIGDLYSLNKSIGESVFLGLEGFPVEVLRIGDVFGKNQRHGNFFRELEKAARAQRPINLYGEGRKTRSYIWIEDLTETIAKICHTEKPGAASKLVHNVAYEEPASNLEIAMAWSRFFDLPINRISDSEANETERIMICGSLRIPSSRSFADALNSYFETIQREI